MKYGSQVIFGRLNHIAKAINHMEELWIDLSQICRYKDKHNRCLRFKKIYYHNHPYCNWTHCTVTEDTEDEIYLEIPEKSV